MARAVRRTRPDWRLVAIPLISAAFHPAMSFQTAPAATSTTTAWGVLSPSTSASAFPRAGTAVRPHSVLSRPDRARRLVAGRSTVIASAKEHINGEVDGEIQLEPSEDDGSPVAAQQPPSPVRWEPLRRFGTRLDGENALGPGRDDTSQQHPLAARSLDSVRSSLIRQEETIIFALIEREQFRQNSEIYTKRTFRVNKNGEADIFGRDASFLEYMLCETEKLHATVRRYQNLEELAFFQMFLPEPILPALKEPRLLAPNDVNVNEQILERYIDEIVPMICEPGDDQQHGSSVVCDVNALQALSRRVHLGKFVAESKFQEDSSKYQELCRSGDARGVLAHLINKNVEKKVLRRAFIKASTYGSDINDISADCDPSLAKSKNFKVAPQNIVDIYRNVIMPLTKDVEIMYLFQRTGYPCPCLDGIHDE